MRNGLFVMILAATGVQAQVVQPLMQNSPASLFTDEDRKIFLASWKKLLEQDADNATESWSNPKNGHGGELTLQRSFEWRGNVCKEVRIRNQAQGRKADTTLNSCKVDGKWRLVSAEQLKK
jgi:surface antigen